MCRPTELATATPELICVGYLVTIGKMQPSAESHGAPGGSNPPPVTTALEIHMLCCVCKGSMSSCRGHVPHSPALQSPGRWVATLTRIYDKSNAINGH